MTKFSTNAKLDPAAINSRGPLDGLQPLRLSELRSGARATYERSEMCCEDCDLLRAMGMTERCEFRVCRAGEPCIVEVNQTRLGISRSLAGQIIVKPVERGT